MASEEGRSRAVASSHVGSTFLEDLAPYDDHFKTVSVSGSESVNREGRRAANTKREESRRTLHREIQKHEYLGDSSCWWREDEIAGGGLSADREPGAVEFAKELGPYRERAQLLRIRLRSLTPARIARVAPRRLGARDRARGRRVRRTRARGSGRSRQAGGAGRDGADSSPPPASPQIQALGLPSCGRASGTGAFAPGERLGKVVRGRS